MIIKQNKSLLAIFAFLMVCLFVNFFSTSLQGSEKRYEIHPEITLPESKTDTARIIDAYERMVNNYLQSIDSDLTRIHLNTEHASKKMDSIDQKIYILSIQLETIQKKLGIEVSKKPPSKSNGTEVDSLKKLN